MAFFRRYSELRTEWTFCSGKGYPKDSITCLIAFAPKDELLTELPNLRIILSPAAGIDRINLELVKKKEST